ncbi:MAG: TIGR00366 family protein [Firmicutes bacterium]|nr:TIGR00366 family protein [Bacillota bacterium]MCL5040046.1 TIGR00366 family protein [Bacillota bacterium]
MIRRLGDYFTRIMENYLPDAYLFAILLTFLSAVLALIFTPKGFMDVILAWGNGIWNLLAFSMQMVLILVTGHTLALTPPVKRFLNWIASLAKTPAAAVAIVALVAGAASWIQWGFGLIIGGLLALEMAKRMKVVDFPLLVAAAYGGFLVWHMGLSGSIPLTIASKGNPANYVEKLAGWVVPSGQTIFAGWNFLPAILLILTIPIVLYYAHPSPEKAKLVEAAVLAGLTEEKRPEKPALTTWAQKIENSVLVNYLFALMGVAYLIDYFARKGFSLDLNIVITFFLFLGIILHQTPINYVQAVNQAIRGAGGIVLQFPLYAGIQGIMMGTGLASVIAGWFVAISNSHTFYLLQFWAAGLINMFIPSGGGQWAAQGSISVMAAQKMNLDVTKTAMMVAWGDQWTNMIQPFWALPLLGLANLKARDIMGYTTLVLLWGGVVMSIAALVMASS